MARTPSDTVVGQSWHLGMDHQNEAKVGCYVHVSTSRQNAEGQEAEIRRCLKSNEIPESAVEWFTDKETGTTLDRPAFKRLQGAVFGGRIRTVLVWKLDRLSRRLHDGVAVLADWTERGVRVVAVTQELDLTGPVGRMVAAVLLGLAEIENDYRRERQAAGIKVAKKQRQYKGRQRGTFKGRPERARALREKGLAAAEIAAAMGISPRSVFQYLQ